jgi:hypothetical protein
MIAARPSPDLTASAARLVRPRSVLLILAIVWGVYLGVLHPWFMNWGSTAEERAMTLPGDTAAPSAYFTRAITIDAPPSAVWPWLVQIGQDRAGFYSNTWLENLTGADIHNADEIRPEWQQRRVGDRVPLARPDVARALGVGEAAQVRIVALEPGRMIANIPGRFVLRPIDDHSTRLYLRERIEPTDGGMAERIIGTAVSWLVWDPMHFVMEQRMLRGIKERAEEQPLVPPMVKAAAQLGWALAGLGLLAAFLSRRGWWPWLLLPIGVVVPPPSLTGDFNSALAGFLAVGITVAGALAYGRRWWPPYLLLASAVALMLLLAPDAYAAFGLVFLLVGTGLAGAARHSARAFLRGDRFTRTPIVRRSGRWR